MNNLSAFFLFALVAGFTPGPNNLLLAASGANFGLRRTLPHMLGVMFGFPVLFAAVGAGLGELFSSHPFLHSLLQITGAAYLLWLAWRVAFAPARIDGPDDAKPLSFLQAAAFQWVNPKAWLMSITAISLYATTTTNYSLQLLLMTAIAFVVSVGSSLTWALTGVGIERAFEHRPRALRAFNVTMGLLLVLSLVPILFNGAGNSG